MEEVNRTKVMKHLQENYSKYDSLKESLMKSAREKYGQDIFEDVSLPSDFDMSSLSDEYFMQRDYQADSMPYSNEQFKEFFEMKKVAITFPTMFNKKGKQVHAVYLIGNDKNGKPVLFALSIIKDLDKSNPNKFSIKLDVCPQGKIWINILRIDSMGPTHPNYIKDGMPVTSEKDVEMCTTPHIHINSEAAQVLCYDNLEYTSAYSIQEVVQKNKPASDPYIFKRCMQYIMEKGNVNVKINDKVQDKYDYNFQEHLFDFNDVWYTQNVDDLKELF